MRENSDANERKRILYQHNLNVGDDQHNINQRLEVFIAAGCLLAACGLPAGCLLAAWRSSRHEWTGGPVRRGVAWP